MVAVMGAALLLHFAKAPERPGPDSGRQVPLAKAVESSAAKTSRADAAAVAAPGRAELFVFAQPANATALDAALPAPTRAISYVRLNRALIEGKQSAFWAAPGAGRVEVPLPEGGMLSVAIDASEMLGADRFVSRGHIEGRPQSTAVFAYNEGFLHATIEDATLGTFALRAATEEFSQFYRVDPELVRPCGGEKRPVVTASVLAAAGRRLALQAQLAAGTNANVAPGTAAAENPQHAEIHVMMAYTRAVLPTLQGSSRVAALQSAFDAAIAKVNAAFAASLITARMKLVRIIETNYARDGVVSGFVRDLQDTALTDLQGGADGVFDGAMDELHAARDQAGADVVVLALNRQDS
ncbi:MAG: hypothetical protein ABIZ49_07050, partial [Opitutaceae bacterium]